ncbi:riboflavin synthase, alpha subunit [Chlamydia ibidis]|uniref:Riboflavin synthase n=2 Tax=Chlamydia ibidis TaxID=1405396 RepID=S7KGY6_9CHLA|nr:riboflavin synthase [Chlamydia ibidis]EPP35441.1 riboflavin synthase, alpha subunit [Chlamydia ibidis]EQM62871.1 riboflavin synthase, alpha subunit [Chlamydia ibidis 10-1398/6]
MFTGIVQELGLITSLEVTPAGRAISVRVSADCWRGLELGASVAIDGVCLTVVKVYEEKLFFDVIPETLSCTTISNYTIGDHVNVERSLKFGNEIGGHILSGHVCGVGEIVRIEQNRYYFQVPEKLSYYLFEKGFIAVDGISLTIVSVSGKEFSVGLIPETLHRTTLGCKRVGDLVNIEPDMATKSQVDTLRRLYSQ